MVLTSFKSISVGDRNIIALRGLIVEDSSFVLLGVRVML
ncbi:hypothetical protein PTE_03986 [Photorhabdus khanii NC19]|uniref:Uncharacterized protein n=1 Tax=Photorhabdus khanii NC19 TaxID=1004151 RepID=W3V187_9GAMM|nr:hypothetical protein PTE_03986 [Photorhabdus khanii NC19]